MLFLGIVVVVIVLIWWVYGANHFRRMTVKIQEAESGIDVALTKRFDVLTKMFDIAKSYIQYEKSTLLSIIQLRSGMSISASKLICFAASSID